MNQFVTLRHLKLITLTAIIAVSTSSCYQHVKKNPYSETSDYNKINEARQNGWMGDKGDTEAQESPAKTKGGLKEKIDKLAQKDIIDPRGGLSRKDYNELFHPDGLGQTPSFFAADKQKGLQLPGLNQLMAEPEKPKLANDKRVSISVTEDVPLKDVIIELARRADVDVEVDPGIEGGVILRMKDRPFTEVIDRISELAGLTYGINDGVLRIERDVPVIRNYRLNLLNQVRTSNSSVTINTNLLGSSSGGAEGGSFSSGSNSQLTSSSENGDMWAVIELGVNNILQQYSTNMIQEEVAGVAPPPPTPAEQGTEGVSQDSLLIPGQSAILSANRQAGLLSIFATKRQHKAIKQYLDQVQMAHSSQVLIEAKILEVSLNDEYRSGIDWSFLNRDGADFSLSSNFDDLELDANQSDQIFSLGILPTELFGIQNTSIEATLDLVQEFGVTRTLSSPRLHAMNNQYAVLTFAENFVYFELDVEEEETEDSGGDPIRTLTVTSEIRTIPVGVLLALQPSIDLARDEIVMNVRPTLSRITNFVTDPGVSLIAAQNNVNISSEIPVVEIRELDSVLRLKSGEVMVIGGLMEERSVNEDTGVPGVADVPVVGNAFKKVLKDTDTVETVIFIKATIIPGEGVSVEDEMFFKKFATGRKAF